ncbi:MAG: CPBP family glutamic-type intramembrane protease [Nocardioides sp.]
MTDQTPERQERPRPKGSDPASWPPPPPPATTYPGQSGLPPGYVPGAPPYAGFPASAEPPEFPPYPHAEPLPYHLMLRNWTYVWWKPVAGLGLLLVLFLAVQFLVAGAFFVIAAVRPGSFLENLEGLSDLSTITPEFLLLLNLSLGAMILATWVTIRVVHRMRPRWLASVAPKMRWRFFWVCVGLSVVALVAQTGISLVLPGSEQVDLGGGVNDFTATTAALALIVLLTTPFQAAGEEYLFRGYLMQAIGSLLGFRSDRWVQLMAKWTALFVTSFLFALAHGAQNFPLFFDRFMFGMIAGWLILHTGGLEVGIAMHILNNFLAFGFALTVGDLGESLNVSEISWWNIPLTLTQSGVYALLVIMVARRMGIQNRTRQPVAEPGPELAPATV